MKHSRPHLLTLLAFLIISFALYVLLSVVAPVLDGHIGLFMLVWGACFLVYFGTCIWVMMTNPLAGRRHWLELGIIFVGAVIFRVMLLHLPLGLSRDAWRYIWDAKLIVHGFSPYEYAPFDKALISLRDIVFSNCPYRELPTKYPPGAELFYVLGYLLTPTNLIGLKSLFILCDLVTCAAIALLLAYKGRDPRYAIIYAWCPLPIVEFAIQGHVDAITITCTVLAVLFAVSSRRWVRLLTGVFIGLAALTKLYPIILLLLLVRRRDWGLLAACAVTIVLGYLPFFLLGHGQILDGSPLLAVSSQRDSHIGVIQNELFTWGDYLHISSTIMKVIVQVVDVVLVSTTLLVVLVQRIRGRMSVEAAVLILTGMVLTVYAHIFPWYATALLPWIAMLAVPIWTKKGFSARGLAITMVWYFTCTAILSYVPGLKQFATHDNWFIYYDVTFGVVLAGFVVAAVMSLRPIDKIMKISHSM